MSLDRRREVGLRDPVLQIGLDLLELLLERVVLFGQGLNDRLRAAGQALKDLLQSIRRGRREAIRELLHVRMVDAAAG